MIIRKILLSFGLALLTISCWCDPLAKGFKRLRIYDYFQAKKLFENALKKKTAGASYGLAVIYTTPNNPFFNTDSALVYIVRAETAYLQTSAKQKRYLAELGVDKKAIDVAKDSVCSVAFKQAQQVNGIVALNSYLQNFSFCTFLTDSASRLRNARAYAETKALNTSAAYLQFATQYPSALEHTDALSRYDERIFEEITATKSISSFQRFLKEQPGNPYALQAEKMIYQLSTVGKTIDQYRNFIKQFPGNRYISQAWQEIYTLYTATYRENILADFKKDFPDYPFAAALEKDYKLQRTFFVPVKDNEGWGYINEDGAEMISPQYEEAQLFSEGLAAVVKNEKYGFINKQGETTIPFEFDDAEPFKNNMAVVVKNEKSGLIDRTGKLLVPFEYNDLTDPVDDIAIAVKNDKAGYITKHGKKLTEAIFDATTDFRNGYAIVATDDRYGVLNMSGHFTLDPQYDELFFLSDTLLKALKNDHWGIVDLMGKTIAPFEYDALGDTYENRILAVKKGKAGFLNGSGSPVIPFQYPFTEQMLGTANFSNGYARLSQKNKAVVIDTSGNKLPLNTFESIGNFSDGLIPVRKNKKWGYASANGGLKIETRYDMAQSFIRHRAVVTQGKLQGVTDTEGKTVIPVLFDKVISKGDYFIVSSKGKSGIVNRDGNTVVGILYDEFEFINSFIVKANKNGSAEYINLKTEKVIRKN